MLMKDDFRYLKIIATDSTEILFWFVTVIIEGVNIYLLFLNKMLYIVDINIDLIIVCQCIHAISYKMKQSRTKSVQVRNKLS